jgi:hypothetical protein
MKNKISRCRKKNSVQAINQVFNKHYFSGSYPTKEANEVLTDFRKILPELRYQLHILETKEKESYRKDLKKQKLTHRADIFPIPPDTRPASETYGYDNIPEDLAHISDRWRSPFRVRWLISVVERCA